MAGHIKMGAPGELRDYMFAETSLYSKSPANQFAAKLATGAGNYDDLQNWSYWVQDDWQLGIGQKDPQAGGFLYGELETRYPGEIRLPRALTYAYHLEGTYAASWAGETAAATGTVAVGTTQAVRRLARRILCTAAASRIYVKLWIARPAASIDIKCSLYSDSAGSPNASVASTIQTLEAGNGYADLIFPITFAASSATNYHVVIEPNVAGETITVPVATHGTSNLFFTYNGSAWASTTTNAFIHEVRGYMTADRSMKTVLYFTAYSKVVTGMENALRASNTDLNGWSTLSTLGAGDVTDMVELGDQVMVGQGNSQNYSLIDSAGSVTSGAVPANRICLWNGYVFRSVGNDVYYSSDLSTWEGPIEICPDGFEVRGMAGLGDYLYVSCDNALYYIGFGDFVFKVANWGSVDSTNGKHMINYQGALIISVGESLMRFDGNAMMPIGLDKGEGLPSNRSGTVAALVAQNNWLFCAITSSSTIGQDTVWAYNDQGWHFITALPEKPNGPTIQCMCYQRDAKRLHIGTNFGHLYTVYAADVARESSSASVFGKDRTFGYIETDWFFGGLKEVNKDFESVYITGENFSSTKFARVYWKDDASTAWELLGTVTSDRQELRWSDYDTRPNSRQLKLRIEIHSNSLTTNPVIRAIRMKYHPMVSDWFRWSLPILVSDNQQEVDGSISTYTGNQKRAHLDGLITQVAPFIFEDMDGTQYEVKVMGCPIQNMKVEWLNGGMTFDSMYNMTIEAIRSGTYEA